MREAIGQIMKTRTRDKWCAALEGTDACFAPVLAIAEAPLHAHAASRAAFITLDGVVQPAPAPRFGRSAPDMPRPAPQVGQHTVEVLSEAGFTAAEIEALGAAAARP